MMDALLEQLDERIRRIIAEENARIPTAGPAPARVSADLVDEETRRRVSEQLVLSKKNYLTRAEVAAYLGVSERSVKEWAVRPADQNPLPEVRAGADPRYRRAAVDEWAEREGQRQRLRLTG